MNWKTLTPLAVFGLLFFAGCSKSDEPTPVQQTSTPDIHLLSQAKLELDLPEAPLYDPTVADERAGGVIKVSPGVDQLQAVINSAGNNAKIKLLAGSHVETNTLIINHPVTLTAEAGATLSLNGILGLYILNTQGVKISDMTIVNGGGTYFGIAVDHSAHVTVEGNTLTGFPVAVTLAQGDHAKVHGNTMTAAGLFPEEHGVVVANGDHVSVKDNDISGFIFGIWACDHNGLAVGNTLYNNLIGLILCKVPPGGLPFGGGTGGSEFPATNWTCVNNDSYSNVYGYMVIDGANNNTLSNNTASSDNFLIDMELVFETNLLFGFFTPTSHDNTVNVGGADIDIIDCGVNNLVHGGTAAIGPCSI